MNITKKLDGQTAVVGVEGRLDTSTAPQLETFLDGLIPAGQAITLDCLGLDYISSAGLRVLLKTQKAMQGKASFKLAHVNENVMEVLEITGFADILTIEQ